MPNSTTGAGSELFNYFFRRSPTGDTCIAPPQARLQVDAPNQMHRCALRTIKHVALAAIPCVIADRVLQKGEFTGNVVPTGAIAALLSLVAVKADKSEKALRPVLEAGPENRSNNDLTLVVKSLALITLALEFNHNALLISKQINTVMAPEKTAVFLAAASFGGAVALDANASASLGLIHTIALLIPAMANHQGIMSSHLISVASLTALAGHFFVLHAKQATQDVPTNIKKFLTCVTASTLEAQIFYNSIESLKQPGVVEYSVNKHIAFVVMILAGISFDAIAPSLSGRASRIHEVD